MLFRSYDHKPILIYSLVIIVCFVILANVAWAEQRVSSFFPLIWNVTNSNEYFTGRKIILDQIRDSFKKKQDTISLLGSSGVGKTQVAKKYAELYKQDYDIIWWIDSEKNIDDQFKKFAVEWNDAVQDKKINISLPSEEITKQVKGILRTTKLSWLLIIDNAADTDKVKDYVPEKHNSQGYGHILITSKNPFTWSNVMKLEKFARDESIELIIKISGKQDKQEANDLAEILGDFPLALAQASTYLKSHPSLSIKEYKELFLTNRNKLWQEEKSYVTKHAAFDNYQSPVLTTFSLIIKEIDKTSPQSLQLLALCSFLNNKNIPKTLIIQYLSDIGVADKLRQEQIISKLLEYSLLTLQESKENYQYVHLPKAFTDNLKLTFTIHEITQLTIQDYLNSKQKKGYLEGSLKSIVKFLPDKIDLLMPLIEQTNFLPHMQRLIFNADKYSVHNKDSALLKIRELEYFLSGKRDFSYSHELILKIEDELLKTPKDKKVALIRFHLMKSVYKAWYDFDYQGTIIEIQKALELLDGLEDSHDEEYLMAYNRLIQSYILTNDRENALKYAKLGENLINQARGFLGNKDVFYHSLARIYMYDEQLDKAYYYTKKAIANMPKVKDRIIIGNLPLNILACEIMIRSNKVEEAYKETSYLLKNTKEIVQNNDDLYMALIMILHGYVSFLKNSNLKTNYNAEIDLLTAGQKMLKRVLGDKYNKNRNTAVSLVFLGDIYKKLGNKLESHKEYLLAEDILNNLYGSDKLHSVEASDLYAKLAVTNVQLADPLTAQKYLTKLQKNFGYHHPKTKQVTNYFLEHGLAVGY